MSRPGYAKTPGGGGGGGAIPKSKGAVPKKKAATAEKEAKPKGSELPAFGLPLEPQKKKDIDFEALKKKNIRRISPAGEDKKGLANVIKSLKDKDVTVEEFISLLAPYSSDNGACFRTVLSEDMDMFRNLARKIYEIMTQDVSDVLLNEHLQLTQYYEERQAHLNDRMMYYINEIHALIPDFNFERFIKDAQQYLMDVLPIPEIMIRDAEEMAMEKRQMAYHRLLWLRTEGDRLAEENERLMRRLAELKRQQAEEQQRVQQMAETMEAERQELEAQEQDMKQQLDELNKSIDKSFLQAEARDATAHLQKSMSKTMSPSTGAIRKQVVKKAGKSRPSVRKKPDWVDVEASTLETANMQEAMQAEAFNITEGAEPPKRRMRRRQPHFSPIKTPPQQRQRAERVVSPFHYSPPKSPSREPQWAAPVRLDFDDSPPGAASASGGGATKKVEQRKVFTMQNRDLPPPRRSGAPPGGYGGGFW